MNSRIGWKAAVVVLGVASMVSAAEVTQTTYRAPNTEAPRGEVTTHATAQAEVLKINKKTRMITLKNEAGETFEIKAGPEVQRFSEIKKGDIVKVDYVESQALYVKKAGTDEKPTHDAGAMAVRGEGEKPSAAAAGTERLSAEVVKVDYKKRLITLKGPDGTVSTMHVPDEVRRLKEIKPGDHVVAEHTVAVAIDVRKP